jgi:hypothetical protein
MTEQTYSYEAHLYGRAIRPTRGEPYRYASWEDAEKCLAMCYPDQRRLGHGLVVRVEFSPNMDQWD